MRVVQESSSDYVSFPSCQPQSSPRRGLFSRAAEALSIRKSGGTSRTTAKDAFSVSPPQQRPSEQRAAPELRPPDEEAPPAPHSSELAGATVAASASVAALGSASPPQLLASISSPTLVDAAKHQQGEYLAVTVLSSKRVHKHQFFMIGVSKPGQKGWTITPRRVQDFRDMHAALTKLMGEAAMPAFPLKKMTANEKDLGQALQEYLQALVVIEAACARFVWSLPRWVSDCVHCLTCCICSKVFRAFLDPYDNPSAFCAGEVLVASKKGPMMVMVCSRVAVVCVIFIWGIHISRCTTGGARLATTFHSALQFALLLSK